MGNSFKNIISTSTSSLIVLPTNPKFDEVAAGLSLYLALGSISQIYSQSAMVVEFNRLVGVNKIKNEIGNKNLAIRFLNYKPDGIEKVSWDIDKGEFKLTIVPKTGVTPPGTDQIVISHEGVAADVVILIGGSDKQSLGSEAVENSFEVIKNPDLATAKLAHVGLHDVKVGGREVMSFDTNGSTVSEVVAKLLKDNGYELTSDIATNLLFGIEEGTQGFATADTSAETFALVSELMRAGGKRLGQGQVNATDFPEGSIPTVPADKAPQSWFEPKIYKGTSTS